MIGSHFGASATAAWSPGKCCCSTTGRVRKRSGLSWRWKDVSIGGVAMVAGVVSSSVGRTRELGVDGTRFDGVLPDSLSG